MDVRTTSTVWPNDVVANPQELERGSPHRLVCFLLSPSSRGRRSIKFMMLSAPHAHFAQRPLALKSSAVVQTRFTRQKQSMMIFGATSRLLTF